MAEKLEEQALHNRALGVLRFVLGCKVDGSKAWDTTPLQVMQIIDRMDHIMSTTQKIYRDKRNKQREGDET